MFAIEADNHVMANTKITTTFSDAICPKVGSKGDSKNSGGKKY